MIFKNRLSGSTNAMKIYRPLKWSQKMSMVFGLTVDFLIGEGESASYDKETLESINDIQKMDANTK